MISQNQGSWLEIWNLLGQKFPEIDTLPLTFPVSSTEKPALLSTSHPLPMADLVIFAFVTSGLVAICPDNELLAKCQLESKSSSKMTLVSWFQKTMRVSGHGCFPRWPGGVYCQVVKDKSVGVADCESYCNECLGFFPSYYLRLSSPAHFPAFPFPP